MGTPSYCRMRGSLAPGPADQGVCCSLRDAWPGAGPSRKVFMEHPRTSAEHWPGERQACRPRACGVSGDVRPARCSSLGSGKPVSDVEEIFCLSICSCLPSDRACFLRDCGEPPSCICGERLICAWRSVLLRGHHSRRVTTIPWGVAGTAVPAGLGAWRRGWWRGRRPCDKQGTGNGCHPGRAMLPLRHHRRLQSPPPLTWWTSPVCGALPHPGAGGRGSKKSSHLF